MNRLLLSASALALAVACAAGPVAMAAEAPARETKGNVAGLDRPRPAYDALGVRVGGFVLKPRLGLGIESTDNVFASERDEKSDVIYSARPGVDVDSQWSRHSVRFTASADAMRHADTPSEDRTNYQVGADGRLDIGRSNFVGLKASLDRYKEPRTSLDASLAAVEQPTVKVSRVTAYAGLSLNRIGVRGTLEHMDLSAGAARLANGGVLDQSTRNRTEDNATARADWEMTADTGLFAEVQANQRKYDRTSPNAALRRDSTGQTFLIGATTSVTRLIAGEAALGYFTQKYDSATVGVVDGLGARARVQWFPTQLSTFTFTAARQVQETDLSPVGSDVATNVGVELNHEYARNVILSARYGYGKYDFRGFDRRDLRRDAGLGVTYLMNRRVTIAASYAYSDGESRGAFRDRDFVVNKFGLGLQLKI